MTTHLTAEEIEGYVKRRASRQGACVDGHLFSCAVCYQRLLSAFQAQRHFPIEIDLDELAGLQGWHLQGEELKSYVAGQMDELDLSFANLHLRGCAWCREEVSHYSEFINNLELYLSRRHAPLKPLPVRSEFLDRFRAITSAWIPLRLAGAAALVLLLISAIWLWSIHRTNSQGGDTTPLAQSKNNGSLENPTPSDLPGTGTPQSVGITQPDAIPKERQITGSTHIYKRASSPVHALQPSSNGENIDKSHREIEASLVAENLAMPSVIDAFDRSSIVLRGDDSQIESFNIIGPFRTVITEVQPVFRWTALTGAASYTVSVYDAKLNLIRTSEPLTESHWTMPSRLERGVTYTWVVTAIKDGKEILAPTLPARAEFKVIEKPTQDKLNRRIRQVSSALARGVLYAEAGLLDEADQELRAHLQLQPNDETAKKLLRTIKSWREP